VTVVQGLWVEGPLSDLERLCLVSYLAHGHEVHLYTYGEVAGLPAGVRVLPAQSVLPASAIFRYRAELGGRYAAFSNLFRYKLLHDRGGWWTDLDMVCLRPLEIGDDWVFAAERRRDGGTVVATAIIKAPQGSAFFAGCFEQALHHPQRGAVWGITGPALLDEAVARAGLAAFVRPPEAFCPIDWFSAKDVFGAVELPAGTWTVHLWNEVWHRNGWPREPRYPPESLYQRLHRQYAAAHSRSLETCRRGEQ
jgi:hypothetical protein